MIGPESAPAAYPRSLSRAAPELREDPSLVAPQRPPRPPQEGNGDAGLNAGTCPDAAYRPRLAPAPIQPRERRQLLRIESP
jgi:hypothetical protein